MKKPALLLCACILTGLAGCGGVKVIPIEEVDHPEALIAATLAATGDLDVALEALYSGAPPADSQLKPSKCLLLSESGFLALSTSEQKAMSEENTQMANAARALARSAMEKAAEATAAGRTDEAQQWKDRVTALGDELANTRHTKILQLVGQAIQKLAATAP